MARSVIYQIRNFDLLETRFVLDGKTLCVVSFDGVNDCLLDGVLKAIDALGDNVDDFISGLTDYHHGQDFFIKALKNERQRQLQLMHITAETPIT